MNAIELKNIRKKLRLTQKELAKLIDVAERTVQAWEYNEQKVPKTVGIFLNQRVAGDSTTIRNSAIVMDVSEKNELTLEEMASFCLEHLEAFEKVPSVKMFIDFHRNNAKAELLEKHIILHGREETN